MKIRDLDDIEREKHNEARDKMRREVSEDINVVLGNVFGSSKKEKLGVFGWIIRSLIFIILGIIVVDIVLGSAWLLKFLIKDLFLK